MRSAFWRLLPLFVFMLLVFFLWRGLSLDPQKLPSVQVGNSLPLFKLPVLGNGSEKLSSADFIGQISLLNVWASWCTACMEEQVFLLQLAKEGIPVFGVNYKDDSLDALAWLTKWGNPYRVIGEDKEGSVAIDLGVYGAPETFLIDKNGVIRFRYAGSLNKSVWMREFIPRIQQLQEL